MKTNKKYIMIVTAEDERYESAVVDILDNNKELITVEINDADFQFIFN